jgi:hypothetical protein
MINRILVSALVASTLLALAGFAVASNDRSQTGVATAATARFHDLGAAQEAGYTIHVADISGVTCIATGAEGAMGDHFANGGLLSDGGMVDAARPEALVYEQRNNGSFKLVALEYLVFQADWEAAGHTSPPELFGHMFMFTPSPNRFGLPPYYSLHAWIWKPNPSGMFEMWNPNVSCDHSDPTTEEVLR